MFDPLGRSFLRSPGARVALCARTSRPQPDRIAELDGGVQKVCLGQTDNRSETILCQFGATP
jgi:hypothetical protein